MLDTLANVKSRLGITTSADDTFLTGQITVISDVIERYCRRKLNAADWIQTFYGDDFYNSPTAQITLYQYPIISVTDLTLDGVEFDVSGLRVHFPTGIIRRSDRFPFFCSSQDGAVFSYRAGYEAGEMPTPILTVLDSLVSERYNKKISGVDLNFGSDVQSITIPGAIAVAFDYTLSNNDRDSSYGSIIGSYANILDDFRSERTIITSDRLEYVAADT